MSQNSLKIMILTKPDSSDPKNELVVVGWKIRLENAETWGGKVTVRREALQKHEDPAEIAVAALLRSFVLYPPPEKVLSAIRTETIGAELMLPASLDDNQPERNVDV